MASLALTLRQIKDHPRQFLDPTLIARVCNRLGYHWRQRELDPATTIGLFIQQVIHGNAPCSEVRHLAHQDFSASAWCQARARLPLPVYQSLVQQLFQTPCAADSHSNGLWRGHRTVHIDGTSFSMPDTPALQKQFGQPTEQKPGCGFPVAHLMVLFNARTGLLMDAIPACWKRGELADLRQSRWAVETNIGHLKTTMSMDVLRCKTVAGVRKELCIFALVYNLVRLVMLEAGRRQRVRVQRMSFADTLKWLRHARPGERLPRLIVNPSRPNRLEPRVKKRRAKPYPLMNKPRAEYKPPHERRPGKG